MAERRHADVRCRNIESRITHRNPGYFHGSKSAADRATILQALGVPDPYLMARLTILIELFGGFAVIVGAFVAIVSLPMAAVLLVAMFTVHLPYGSAQ